MTTIVGILTFMSRINFVLSGVEHGKNLLTSGVVESCRDSHQQSANMSTYMTPMQAMRIGFSPAKLLLYGSFKIKYTFGNCLCYSGCSMLSVHNKQPK